MTNEKICAVLLARWPDCKARIMRPPVLFHDIVVFELCPDRNSSPPPVMGTVYSEADGVFSVHLKACGLSASDKTRADDGDDAAVCAVLRAADGLRFMATSASAIIENKVRRLRLLPTEAATSTHEGAQAEAVAYFTARFPDASITKIDEGCLCRPVRRLEIACVFNSWRENARGEWKVAVRGNAHLEGFGPGASFQKVMGGASVDATICGPDLGACVDAALDAAWRGFDDMAALRAETQQFRAKP